MVLLLLGGIDRDIGPGGNGCRHVVRVPAVPQRDQHGTDLWRSEGGNADCRSDGAFERRGLHATDVLRLGAGTARLPFQSHRLTPHIELNSHRVADREKRQTITTRSYHAPREPHNLVEVLTQLKPFTEFQSE